jgi:small subunit ribosomal protein S8
MSVNDPIADMLTRIRNATAVRHDFVMLPASRMKRAIAQVLKDEGFVARFEQTRDKQFPMLKIYLKYTERKESILRGMKRVSKPGMGTVILSTPRGVVSGAQARRLGVGGEILCEVW